jgi:hypothetical protein
MENIALINDIQGLYGNIAELIKQAKTRVAVAANAELTMLNWTVGKSINDFILKGNRAPYGKQIIAKLSELLVLNFGTGWSSKQLMHCLRSAESFSEEQIVSAMRRQLSWTHLKTISYEKDALKREFYLEMSIIQRWNTRTLADQIDKMLFERTAIAKKPERQKRISIDAVDYHLDLLFYHRKLKRLVAIDLKLGKFKHEYKSQMELYLRWLERNEMQKGEEKPIGLLLCSEGNTEHIELLMLDEKEIKVAQYLTELPSKKWFADKLHRAIEIAKMNDEA